MAGQIFQQDFKRALILIAILLPPREADVGVDAGEEQAEQDHIRDHEKDADKHQLLRYLEALEESKHDRGFQIAGLLGSSRVNVAPSP